MDVAEFSFKPGRTKKGRYHGSVFHGVSGFGVTRWVFGCYILTDIKKHRKEGISDRGILEGCINYLNKPPVRKKFQKKAKGPLFGNLEILPKEWKIVEKDGQQCFITLLITDERKNKNLWGEGPQFNETRKKRNRQKRQTRKN